MDDVECDRALGPDGLRMDGERAGALCELGGRRDVSILPVCARVRACVDDVDPRRTKSDDPPFASAERVRDDDGGVDLAIMPPALRLGPRAGVEEDGKATSAVVSGRTIERRRAGDVPEAELLDDPSRAIAADRDGMRLWDGEGVRARLSADTASERLSVDDAPVLR